MQVINDRIATPEDLFISLAASVQEVGIQIFSSKYRLKFQMAMNDVYFLCIVYTSTLNMQLKKSGRGSGLGYLVLLSHGGLGLDKSWSRREGVQIPKKWLRNMWTTPY